MSRRGGPNGLKETFQNGDDAEISDPLTQPKSDDDRAVPGIVVDPPSPGGVANDLAPAEASGPQMAPLSIEDRYEAERETARIRHWKSSPFAAGLVEPTWSDELTRRDRCYGSSGSNGPNRNCCDDCADEEIDPTCGCLYASGVVCSKVGAGRIGNMAVLREGEEWHDEEVPHDPDASDSVGNGGEGGGEGEKMTRRVRRRTIEMVVGPYWPMLFFVTWPLVLGVSMLTAIKAIPSKSFPFVVVWAVCTGGLIYALFSVSCRDPGIMRRHEIRPVDGDQWRWNDQAQTYRPRGAVYDPDCAVVVEDFDHTCPWTGTAIGKKNMPPFQAFVALVFVCLILDIFLLTNVIG